MMKMPASLVPGEGSLPGLYIAAFQLSSNSGTERERGRERELCGYYITFYKDSNPVGSGPQFYEFI